MSPKNKGLVADLKSVETLLEHELSKQLEIKEEAGFIDPMPMTRMIMLAELLREEWLRKIKNYKPIIWQYFKLKQVPEGNKMTKELGRIIFLNGGPIYDNIAKSPAVEKYDQRIPGYNFKKAKLIQVRTEEVLTNLYERILRLLKRHGNSHSRLVSKLESLLKKHEVARQMLKAS